MTIAPASRRRRVRRSAIRGLLQIAKFAAGGAPNIGRRQTVPDGRGEGDRLHRRWAPMLRGAASRGRWKLMNGFVSSMVMKIDRKGRVSVPAAFRQVLSRDGFEGLYCYPSIDMPAIDCGGNALLGEIERRLARFEPFTEDHDLLSTAFYGSSERLTMDAEGRIGLTETLLLYAGIASEVAFVGQGYKFQVWEPSRFREHQAEARRRALLLRKGLAPVPSKSGEEPT